MHAVVVNVTISDREAAQRRLEAGSSSGGFSAPGFQTGYWTWKNNSGLSMAIFDSEETATNQPTEPAT